MSRVRFENRAPALPGQTKKPQGFATGAPNGEVAMKTRRIQAAA